MVANKPLNQFLYRLQPSNDLGGRCGSGCGSVCVLSVTRTVVETKVHFKTCFSHNIGCANLSYWTIALQLLNTGFSIKTCFRKKGVHMKKCCLGTGKHGSQSLLFYALGARLAFLSLCFLVKSFCLVFSRLSECPWEKTVVYWIRACVLPSG